MANASSGPEPGWVRLCAGTVAGIDGLCRWSGYLTAWLTLGTVVVCFATVYMRYVLGTGLIWLQELYVWQHAAVIMLGSAYTMMTGGFVRVDVFYTRWSDRRRAATDLVMTLVVLVPFLWIFGAFTWNFFLVSWRIDEGSLNPQGLPNVWLLKGAMVAFVALVALQGLAFVLRGVMVLAGHPRYVLRHGGHGPEQPVGQPG